MRPTERRGLRLAFFNVEEWALTGSRIYVDGLDAAARDAIALVLNLDSVAGSPHLTALTSEFSRAEAFLNLTKWNRARLMFQNPHLVEHKMHKLLGGVDLRERQRRLKHLAHQG